MELATDIKEDLPDKALAIALAQEVLDHAADVEDKTLVAAAKRLIKLPVVGSVLDIRFTAVDGREVALSNYKGKVVLVDFWATWCSPCIAELPKVKRAYQGLHSQGFEIIGISFDSNKERLVTFLKREQLDWPQYFDGLGWGNKYGEKYGINAIPKMWLIDKQGTLRHLNARNNFEEKVKHLLAEDAFELN